jgi:hypothetical protein
MGVSSAAASACSSPVSSSRDDTSSVSVEGNDPIHNNNIEVEQHSNVEAEIDLPSDTLHADSSSPAPASAAATTTTTMVSKFGTKLLASRRVASSPPRSKSWGSKWGTGVAKMFHRERSPSSDDNVA